MEPTDITIDYSTVAGSQAVHVGASAVHLSMSFAAMRLCVGVWEALGPHLSSQTANGGEEEFVICRQFDLLWTSCSSTPSSSSSSSGDPFHCALRSGVVIVPVVMHASLTVQPFRR